MMWSGKSLVGCVIGESETTRALLFLCRSFACYFLNKANLFREEFFVYY